MRLFAALLVLIGLSHTALAQDEANSCVNTRRLGSHSVVDDNTLLFSGRGHDYIVTTRGCRLGRAERLGFRLQSSYLCKGDTIMLLDYDNHVVGHCLITSIEAQ